jgi:ubiquinone/menaquinone biosynthesis C-methylase UbiE
MRVISVDLSVTGLTHAVLTVDRPLMVAASVDRLPLTAESVDMVVCFGVLYYLPLPKLQRAIEEIRRVLRPGGSALVVTRTTRDYRYSTGVVIDDHHVIVTQHTGEQGIAQTFLTEDDLSSLFGSFPSVTMNYNDFTLGEESNLNSDWVIQVTR